MYTRHRGQSLIRSPFQHFGLLVGFATILAVTHCASWSSVVLAQNATQQYRLSRIVIPELITDPSDPYYEAGVQKWFQTKNRAQDWSVERRPDGTIYFLCRSPEADDVMVFENEIDLENRTMKYTRNAGNYKGNDRRTFSVKWTPPPELITSEEPFTIGYTATVKGTKVLPHYPHKPTFDTVGPRLTKVSSSGRGSPVYYHDDYKWKYTEGEFQTWSCSVTAYVESVSPTEAARKKPWILTLGLAVTGGNYPIKYVYEMVDSAGELTGGGSSTGGGRGSGGTDDSSDRKDGGPGDGSSDDGRPPLPRPPFDDDIFVGNGGPCPPWCIPGTTGWDSPTRQYRPPSWLDCELRWPPVLAGGIGGRGSGSGGGSGPGSYRPGDVDTWWRPGPVRGPGFNCRNGGARILLADRRRVPAGSEVSIPIFLFYPRGTANLSFDVEYDRLLVQPVGNPQQGSLIRLAQNYRSNVPESGLTKVAFAMPSALQRSGIVAFAQFRAVGSPGSRATLRLDVTDLEDPEGRPLAIDLYDGEIEIIRPDEGLPGDRDGDFRLTVFDAQSALDMDVQRIPEDLRLDVNNDGKVTSSDARIIFQQIEIGTGSWRASR